MPHRLRFPAAPRRRRARLAFGVLLLTALCTAPTRADDVTVEDAFARAARLRGDTYRIARDVLERQGKEIVPLLKEKAKSQDWRERDLARVLLHRLEHPDKAAVFRRLLAWDPKLTFRPDRSILIRFDPREAESAKQFGKPVPPMADVVVDRRSAPLALDLLRELIQGMTQGHRGFEMGWRRQLQMLKHFADLDSAPALLHYYELSYSRDEEPLLDALQGLGKPIVPVLRKAVASGTPKLAAGAALVLGRLGDRDSAGLLLERLKTAREGPLVDTLATALGKLGAPEALPVIFEHAERSAALLRDRKSSQSYDPSYPILRQALLGFGKEGEKFLRSLSRKGQPVSARARAAGLLFELGQPKEAAAFYARLGTALLKKSGRQEDPVATGRAHFWWSGHSYGGRATLEDFLDEGAVPAPLRLERAYVLLVEDDLVWLAGRKGDDLAFEVAADGLRALRFDRHRGPRTARALGMRGDERALDVFADLLGPKRPAHFIPAVIEATLLLGSPKGAPVLEAFVQRVHARKKSHSQEMVRAADLAAAVLPALKDGGHLHKLLDHPNKTVSAAAARLLAARADLRAAPVLVRAAAEARGETHALLREALVSLGKPALEAVEKVRKGTEDWRLGLFCEAAELRIRQPELGAKLEQAARVRDPGFSSRAGPTVHTYKGAGARVAAAVGKEALPLLEAALAFRTDLDPGIAIFAVAQLQQERSILLLLKAHAEVGGARGQNFVPVALQQFGDKGIAAVKKIPPPDPAKAELDRRQGRFRGATETLAIAQEVKGVDNILDFLKLPGPAKGSPELATWTTRARVYLGLARNYHDRRLVEPVFKLLGVEGAGLEEAALQVLADYKDERVAERVLSYVLKEERSNYASTWVQALVKQLGAKAALVLVKRFEVAKETAVRVAAARALGDLVAHPEHHFGPLLVPPEKRQPPKRDWREVGLQIRLSEAQKAEARKLAAEVRELALPPLRKALGAASPEVQRAAASALVGMTSERYPLRITDARPVADLAAWARRQKVVPDEVVPYLVASRHREAGPALLALYRASDRRHVAVIRGLAELGYEDAVPELVRALTGDRARGDISYRAELDALSRLGKKGQQALLKLFNADPPLNLRVRLAWELSRIYPHPKQLAGEVAGLFASLSENGLWDPRLRQRGNDRQAELHRHLDQLAQALVSADPKRAYPLLCLALLRADDESLRSRMAYQIQIVENNAVSWKLADAQQPDIHHLMPRLPRLPEALRRADADPPEVRLLALADLWRGAAVYHGDPPAELVKKLMAESDLALEALVEMCYPPAEGPTKEAVAAAVGKLADPKARGGALAVLAFGKYPHRYLAEALARADGEAARYGRAVQKWRLRDPWFVDGPPALLWGATAALEVSWPIEKLRAFALRRLDRLALVEQVEHNTGERPLTALLASVRYSPKAEERQLLADFVQKARPGAGRTAAAVMAYGFRGSTRSNLAPHWRELPPHNYRR
jgi:HEAT repeat protein